MPKLFEILAAEPTVTAAAVARIKELGEKLQKTASFFQGSRRSLKMLEDNLANGAVEDAALTTKPLITSVAQAMEYALGFWAASEDLQATKNVTNTKAVSDLILDGKVLMAEVPVDELMGLGARLKVLRSTLDLAPTLNLSTPWQKDPQASVPGSWVSDPVTTTKTEKHPGAVILVPATDKHPAQIEKIVEDRTVGKFTTIAYSGELTASQKAKLLSRVDALIAATQTARQRANDVPVVEMKLGSAVVEDLLSTLKE